MDKVRADRIANELSGREVDGWKILEYLGSGKSAVVVRGEKRGLDAALKIFDPELVERFGPESQLARIRREATLIGHGHPHLVEILDGGKCSATGYLYVAMELVAAPILSTVIQGLPKSMIGITISQLASAAEFLEEKGLAHRDIKPDNMAISEDFGTCKLMDLGVLRPLGGSDVTDSSSQVPFIGTLRYSSPEFLLREEEDTVEGWRAVTFYQIGGVLHDLIMGKPLFAEFSEPYARLVQAVTSEVPVIKAVDVSPDLVLLARNCLVKDPRLRLELVGWTDFQQVRSSRSGTAMAKERILKRRALMQGAASGGVDEALHAERIATQIVDDVARALRILSISSSLFPPLELEVTYSPSSSLRLIHLRFAPKPEFLLSSGLGFFFSLSLLDAKSVAVEIKAAAVLSTEKLDPMGRESVIYKGVYSEEQVTPILDSVLVRCLDHAQQLDDPSGDSGGEQPKWLPTDQEESLGNG